MRPGIAFARAVLALITLACMPGAVSAQAGPAPAPSGAGATEFVLDVNEPKRALKEGKVVRAVRVTTPPSIDGRLGDEVWTLAPHATGFMQRDPDNGQAMTRQTLIQIAYDDRFLYIAATCLDDNGSVVSGGPRPPRRTAAHRHDHDRDRPAARSSDRLRVSDQPLRLARRPLDHRR